MYMWLTLTSMLDIFRASDEQGVLLPWENMARGLIDCPVPDSSQVSRLLLTSATHHYNNGEVTLRVCQEL